jgi:hypothetical protein
MVVHPDALLFVELEAQLLDSQILRERAPADCDEDPVGCELKRLAVALRKQRCRRRAR